MLGVRHAEPGAGRWLGTVSAVRGRWGCSGVRLTAGARPRPEVAGAAGVVAKEGSSLLAELDFATDAELEAQHVKYGYTLDARNKSVQAQYAKYQAGQIDPGMSAGISLLSSGGSIATAYYANRPQNPAKQTGGGLDYKSGTTLGSPGSK